MRGGVKFLWKATLAGAFLGVLIAILLLSLDHLRPFSPETNGTIDQLVFRLCPLYILGFANGMGSMTVLVIVTVLGNAVLYGITIGFLIGLPMFFRKKAS